MHRPRTRASKRVAVAEDWYPTVDGMVDVRLVEYGDGHAWRVVVKGGDDTAMEIDLGDEAQARELFERIHHLVTKADLASWGFVRG